MNSVWKYLLCAIGLLVFAPAGFAKEWNNITPLKTTRADVIQILGNPILDDSDNGEHFNFNNYVIRFRWTRANCFAEPSKDQDKPKSMDDLVLQITVEPKYPQYEKIVEEELESEQGRKREIKDVYKKWLSSDLHCFGNSCTISNFTTGFGYTSSKDGFTALYYVATEADWRKLKEGLEPCSVDLNAAS